MITDPVLWRMGVGGLLLMCAKDLSGSLQSAGSGHTDRYLTLRVGGTSSPQREGEGHLVLSG